MFQNSYLPRTLSALALLSTACTFDASDAKPEALGDNTDELYLTGVKWPSGVVPVCFTTGSQAAVGATYQTIVRRIRDAANNTWSTAAKIDFTGWGTCPANTNGMLAIELKLSGTSWSEVGYHSNATTDMSLNVQDTSFLDTLVPHEFGHAIGFAHEFQRFDWNLPCDEPSHPNVAGDNLGTPPDGQSLLFSTYCGFSTTTMSAWDAFGVINAYGRRVNAARPLVTGWSGARNDHATVASDAAMSNVVGAGYSWAYAQGWLLTSQLPGTIPLKLYWSSARNDNVTLASAQTQADVVAAGYASFGTEGYVFSAQQPGTVPLKQYWSNARLDHMLVIPGVSENAAIGAGYTFVRVEGYVPSTIPYSLLWTYWSNARLDNAVTQQASTLSQNLHDASYEFAGFDGAIWRHAYPGTSQLKNYWSNARLDHFALANSTSQSDAVAAGYTLVSAESQPSAGYLHNTSVSGLAPMNSYWSTARTEHFTTIGRGAIATSHGYSLVRTEGWGLATN